MDYIFDSKIELSRHIGNFPQEIVKKEPMMFSADASFAYANGGILTREFIDNLTGEFHSNKQLIVDSRVHMLMPGMYPCIPGFHHDDVPRERSDGQPEYLNPSYKSKHCMAIFGGGARTKFALGCAPFPEVPLNQKYYKVWHPIVQDFVELGVLKRYDANYGEMIYFDWNSWHEGTPAYETAFRFFIRASINTNRKPKNELRTQTQVYLEVPMEGW